jgi:hypothetical protein
MQPLDKQVSDYISSEGLTDLYPILVYQIKLCEARDVLVKDSCQLYRKYLTEVEDSFFSADSIIKLQATQLDVVSKLFMFMEDYLSFSYYLHTSKKELPREIQSRHSVVWDEVEYLENVCAEEIQKYLLLPEVEKLPISNIERNFVNDTLKVISGYI